MTRLAWRAVAERIPVSFIEVEVVCSNLDEHRRRVETRVSDIQGSSLPTWQQVEDREYEPWPTAGLVIDTSKLSTEEAVALIYDLVALKAK
jgi:hypothetical protein